MIEEKLAPMLVDVPAEAKGGKIVEGCREPDAEGVMS
jgi:hypothetical protein